MSTVLVFREGCSGHFVQAVLEEHGPEHVSYRMPENSQTNKIFVTHKVDTEFHNSQYDLALRILPDKKIYNAIYNNFSKKLLLEDFSNFEFQDWIKNPIYWYDICFYNIKEYFELHLDDIQENKYKNVINFDNLLDKKYFAELLQMYFQSSLTNQQIELIEKYSALQLQIDLCHDDVKDMRDIIEPIPENLFVFSPWFFSYCIFKFENNNNLTESQRLWSINQLEKIQNKAELLELSKRYQ